MQFSLIICTYQRPKALMALLESVKFQSQYPDQIIIVDGSRDDRIRILLQQNHFPKLEYFQVGKKDRGLTRQRNFGIKKVNSNSEVIFFLDDDTILHPEYFEEILNTYKAFPDAKGVSGYITNETEWREVARDYNPAKGEFVYEGWARTEGSRFSLRRKLGLGPDAPPGFMPDFSHGYSTGFLPPSGKTYEVELLMGGIASYRREIFQKITFSPYFEGYGLYEDADFSLRASRHGKLFVNTAAKVEHHHAAEGRPNKFKYGKMVVRNGWYVWRVKNPSPSAKAKLKWHSTSFLLTLVRFLNIFNTSRRKEAFSEALGRIWGWCSLHFNEPKVK